MIRVTVIADIDERVVREAWESYRADGGAQAFLPFRRLWAEEHAREMMVSRDTATYEASFALDLPAVSPS